ncbi:MAG TPA: hypothetical protein VFT79_05030 [Solirubrobacterales bacterium]|nr:hypothetical protein [Solirubrobacterales bacterium]
MGRLPDLLLGGWRRRLLAGAALAAIALALGAPAPAVAVCLLAGAMAVALLQGGWIVRRALEVSQARGERRLESASARRGLALVRTHDWLRQVQDSLRTFLARAEPGAEAAEVTEASLEMLEGIRESLDSSRTSRSQFKRGHVPIVGGNADAISKRLGGALKPYSWTPAHLFPGRLRGATTQTSMVLDEIRVLHNAEIERSVLLLTLVTRAILVLLAPLLGGWTSADTPLTQTGAAADLVWVLAAAISVATLLDGPRTVDLAMTDSAEAHRFRRRLLWVEVPVALALLLLLPAWTVVVFVTGWTNWWQRQTPGLAFDWRKLAIFVGAVVALQGAGLALQSVQPPLALAEIAAALAAIAITGGSYGAMLPLTVATALAVVVGDGTRSIRVARAARLELLACSKQLNLTAATIDAAAPEMPLARNAASLARKGARNLEREADLFGRRGVQARQVLADLFDQAVTQSTLPRSDSQERKIATAAAKAAGQPPPPYVVEPLLGDLALARIGERRHARILQRFLVVAMNEAGTHGTGGVRLLARHGEARFTVTVGNLPKAADANVPGEGQVILERLAGRLPAGRLTAPPGLRPAEAVDFPVPGQWWVAELECDVKVLTIPLE